MSTTLRTFQGDDGLDFKSAAVSEPWIPTTQDIREAVSGTGTLEASRAAAFDRWLAQHDAEVRRDARKPKTAPCGHTQGSTTSRGTPIVCDRVEGHSGSHSYRGRWIWR